MSIKNILTSGGFEKIRYNFPERDNQKLTLYYLKDLTQKKIKRAEEALLKLKNSDERETDYRGKIKNFAQKIQEKPYLLKEKTEKKITLWLLKGEQIATSDQTFEHQITVSQEILYLFKNKVEIGGNFNVTGSNASIIFQISSVYKKSNDKSNDNYHINPDSANYLTVKQILMNKKKKTLLKAFYDPDTFDKLRQNIKISSTAVCQITTGDKKEIKGTAFLIASDLLITTQNILPDIEAVNKSQATFYTLSEEYPSKVSLQEVKLNPDRKSGG